MYEGPTEDRLGELGSLFKNYYYYYYYYYYLLNNNGEYSPETYSQGIYTLPSVNNNYSLKAKCYPGSVLCSLQSAFYTDQLTFYRK